MIRKQQPDYLIFIGVIVLAVFGLIMIFSSSSIWAEFKYNDPYRYVRNQALFFIVGVILMFIISKWDYHFLMKYSNILLIGALILLILVIIPGIGTIRNGSRSWFGIGSFGIQPSEAVKLVLIIFTSKYLALNEKSLRDIKTRVFPILIIVLLCFALIMLQPDFGTGMVLIMSIIGLLFASGVVFSFFVKIAMLGMVGIVGLIAIAPYRLARILSFLNPWNDPLGSGFQIIQSLYAIGPGGLLGLGFGNSLQKHFYLPEPQTDFIFSIISEEFGFLGVLIVAGLFLLIIIRGLNIARHCNDLFGKFLSFGIIFQIAFQTILNLAVVTGIIPVTGVTLPFLSYGGSSLLITMISMGILLNISRYQEERLR